MLKPDLLAAKLRHPPRQGRWVQRPYLDRRLNEGLARGCRVTLVSAPAGFGKTTCIIDWTNTLACPVAWLSLDPGDDDPGRFFAYLIAALQNVDARFGREIEGALQAGQIPESAVIAASLSNEMLAFDQQFLLVLDDFHLLQDRAVLSFWEQLVANLPPPLHLVLITREDPPLPLARLRANSLLSEIRAQDLRFTGGDVDRFLSSLGLSLDQSDVAALEDKTEGWIVGLQLAAVALQSAPAARDAANPSDFIAALSGNHRFILSYLTEQVLDQQPDDLREFLLQTAVLERLHGDLCNAVTGRTDGRSMLEQLLRANLFLVPLDDEGLWYRYHHLFADLLKERQRVLRGQETVALHRRAGRWYAQEKMAPEAVRHALAAADYALVVDLLESHAMQLIMQGNAKTVNDWVQAVPEPWRWQSPRTHLAFAWMHLLRGAYAEAEPYLAHVEKSFSAPQESTEERQALKAEWLVMRSLLLTMEGDAAQSLALADEALAIAPLQNIRLQSLAYFGLGTACQAAQNIARAENAYHKAIQYARDAQNLVAEMLSSSTLAMMALENGRLHLAYEIAAPLCERIDRSGLLPPISAVIYGALAEVHYQWAQFDEGRRHAERALQLSTLGGYKSGVIGCLVLLSRLSQAAGNLQSAAQEIEAAVEQLQIDAPDYVRQEAGSQQVSLYLALNRPAAAEMALRGLGFAFQGQFTYPDFASDKEISFSLGLLYNSSLRFILYLAGTGRHPSMLKSGVELADQLLVSAVQSRQIPVALQTTLLRAQMRAALGNRQAGLADYEAALEMAEPQGFIAAFIEQGPPAAKALAEMAKNNQTGAASPSFIARILAAFAGVQPLRTAHRASYLLEPLSERELEVLRLLMEGLTYKEIAARLFISLNTVRHHVKALYGKLNVNNRTQAIEAARQRQIL